MTDDRDYTERLETRRSTWWKQALDVQRPYRWNIRRLELGRVLDVGCGIGRILEQLDGNGVGVDTNPTSVQVVRDAGLTAYTVDEFAEAPESDRSGFDSVLFAHVLEHMDRSSADELVGAYLPYLEDSGRVCVIVPQERGFASDATHVEFLDAEDVVGILQGHGLHVERSYSFPFPRAAGRLFTYNETVVLANLPPVATG